MSLYYPIHLKISTWLYVLLFFCPLLGQQTIIDTIYTENLLQTAISKYVYSDVYLGGVVPPNDSYVIVGDSYDQWYLNEALSSRFYVSFQIQPVPENYQVDSVIVCLYQDECYNNDLPGVFPEWYCSCNVYHVDYGLSIEPTDFDPFEYGLIGSISSDNVNGWKRLNITSAYLLELNQGSMYCQLMVKFPLFSDYDFNFDGIIFETSYNYHPEQINIYYSPIVTTYDETAVPINTSVFPNPFNSSTSIMFLIPKATNVKISVYDVKGQLVKVLCNEEKQKGKHTIIWDGKNNQHKSVGSGMYLFRMEVDGKKVTSKAMLLK